MYGPALKSGLQRAGLHASYFAWPPTRNARPIAACARWKVNTGIFFGGEAPVIEAIDRLRGLTEGQAANSKDGDLASSHGISGAPRRIPHFGFGESGTSTVPAKRNVPCTPPLTTPCKESRCLHGGVRFTSCGLAFALAGFCLSPLLSCRARAWGPFLAGDHANGERTHACALQEP
jgi:hypothetical protein